MTVIVTDTGFGTDDLTTSFISLGEAANAVAALDVPSDAELSDLDAHLNAEVIRVDFPSSADGRGFTIARQLRLKGFTGRLRARGHVLADQYAMARRSGFDEVEIDAALAERQPEDQWLFRANWQEHDYQNRLRAKAAQ